MGSGAIGPLAQHLAAKGVLKSDIACVMALFPCHAVAIVLETIKHVHAGSENVPLDALRFGWRLITRLTVPKVGTVVRMHRSGSIDVNFTATQATIT